MTIHKEGYRIIIGLALALGGLNTIIGFLAPGALIFTGLVALVLFLLVLQFFRSPRRLPARIGDGLIYAPADGRVVVIEETEEKEYFQDKRLQISIFMSIFDVHCNRIPVGGRVKYYRYHPGRYLAAWHPKASTDNERNTIVIDTGHSEILLRQIAGLVARRIRCYLREDQPVDRGDQLGFIKFGSRLDMFLPLDTQLEIEPGQQVYAGKTVIGLIP